MEIITYVPANVPFLGLESTHQSLKEVLNSLSLTDTIFWCARLNQILSIEHGVTKKAKQEYFIQNFLNNKEASRVNTFAINYGGAENVVLISRGQILELVRWATFYLEDSENDGLTFESRKTRRAFAQAALICSKLWSQQA